MSEKGKDELTSSLGGIFGVQTKKKAEPAPSADEPEVAVYDAPGAGAPAETLGEESSSIESETAASPEAEPEAEDASEVKVSPAPKKGGAAVPQVEKPATPAIFAASAASTPPDREPYLDDEDLDGLPPGGGISKGIVIGAIVALLAIAAAALLLTDFGQDARDIMTGDYRAKKLAEVERQEAEFKRIQEEKLPKFGNLTVLGTPKYATIKLDGSEQYAQLSGGEWREISLIPGSSNFPNLPTKEDHVVEVSSPGFETRSFDLTEGKWEGDGPLKGFQLTATLTPTDEFAQAEFDARMTSDPENDYFGTMTIESTPPGATVILNNKPLLDESGAEMKTPATFDKYYVRDEKGKLEEVAVRVDTTIDQGHKLQVSFPQNKDLPAYATMINRPMWSCERIDEEARTKLKPDHSPQLECSYVFKKAIDFNALAAYIEAREERRKEVEERNAEIKKLRAEMAAGNIVGIDESTAKSLAGSGE